jgi:hypothetical protein
MFNPRERHFSVIELATCWNASTDLIRDLFANEPGVIKISRRTSLHERPPSKTGHRKPRKWVMLRIPEPVVERVYRRLLGEGHFGGGR